jgi:arsenite-transporting ATPase
VLPDHDEGEFFKQRKKHEQKYIDKINKEFQDKQLIFVPFFSHDIINIQQLEKFSQYLVEK